MKIGSEISISLHVTQFLNLLSLGYSWAWNIVGFLKAISQFCSDMMVYYVQNYYANFSRSVSTLIQYFPHTFDLTTANLSSYSQPHIKSINSGAATIMLLVVPEMASFVFPDTFSRTRIHDSTINYPTCPYESIFVISSLIAFHCQAWNCHDDSLCSIVNRIFCSP